MPRFILPCDDTLLFKDGEKPVYFKDVVNPYTTNISMSTYIDNPLSTEKYGAVFCGQMVLGEHGPLMKKKINSDVLKTALRAWFDTNMSKDLNVSKQREDQCFYYWAFTLLDDKITGWDREMWMRLYNVCDI